MKMKFLYALSIIFGLIYASTLNAQTDNFPGTTLEFDGTDDYVSIPDESDYDFTDSLTIEAWIKVNAFDKVWQAVINKGDDAWRLQRYTNTNNLDFGTNGLSNLDLQGSTNVNDGHWHHIAAVFDGSYKYLYVDGTLDASVAVTGTISTNDLLVNIAENAGATGRNFNGMIDEVRIWNRALDSTQIREHMNLPLTGGETGLVSYWQFNDGSGTTLSDDRGLNDGTLQNMTDDDWVTSTIPFGPGYSDTETETNGTVDFTNTGLSIYFNSQNGASITVTRIDTTANVNPQDVDNVLDKQYWVINRYGTGSFNADLTFTVNENITSDIENAPGMLRLYKRSSTSDSTWSFVKSADSVNAANNTVTFNGITGFGQFIITKEIIDNYPGTALNFDGTDDYVSIPNESDYDFTDSLTVEAWIKVNAFDKIWQAVINKGDDAWRLQRYTSTNNLDFGTNGLSNLDLQGSTNVNDGHWHHIAAVFDGSYKYLYVDGRLDASVAVTGTISTNDLLVNIAENTGATGRNFNGTIDEVRIWNRALDSTQIREHMNLPLTGGETGLVSYWQFNDGSGTTLSDDRGLNDGTLQNMTDDDWVTSTIPFGPGYSDTETETSGTVDFTNTGLSMHFNSQNGASITVTRIDTAANVRPQNADSIFYNQYWVVNRYGTGSFNAGLTFTTNEDITSELENKAGKLQLYQRSSTSDSTWSFVKSADSVNAANNTITFNGITVFGQFIIIKEKVLIDNYPGTALDFDGADDYVNCGTGTQITGNNPRTIEAWAYTENFNQGAIFQAGATGTSLADFSFRTLTTDNHWRVQLWGSDMDVTLNDSKNSWHHYCLTYNGSTVKLYYDGELSGSMNATLNTGSHDVWFGRWWNHYFDGKIDEIRIWNRALDSTEIRENMNLPLTGSETGLISYWQFNDSSGTTLSDFVSGYTGTLTNMTNDDWVASTIPFGPGYSDTETETNGTIDFTNTGLSMNFNSQNGASVTVTRIDTTPNVIPQNADTVFDEQYWVVNRYGTGSFNTDLTFTVSENLTTEDETYPSHIQLFTRGSTGNDAWTYFASASAVNAANNTVTFSGITEFGQFILCKSNFWAHVATGSDTLDFGTIEPGDSVSLTVTLSNTGVDTLEISSISVTHSFFSCDTHSCTLPPNDSIDVTVTFAPLTVIELSEFLLINSNDPDSEKHILLTGKAVRKIVLLDSPQSFTLVTDNLSEIDVGDYSSPTFTDLDGDGRLDLLIGGRNGKIVQYEQDTVNSVSFTLVTDSLNAIDVGVNSAPAFTDLDGDGRLDLLIGEYDGNINHYEQDSVNSASFTYVTNNFNGIDVGVLSAPVTTDLNGDRLLDLLIGEQDLKIDYYKQDAGNPASFTLVTDDFNGINVGLYSTPAFTDLNDDGRLDMLIGEMYGTIWYYEQDSVNSTSFSLVTDNFNGIDVGSNSAPTLTDLDGDGLLDMLIGKQSGKISRYEQTGCDSLAFGHLLTGNTSTKNYYIKANSLTADLVISCTGIYQISLSENSGYAQSLSVTPVDGNISDTVFVRFQPVAEQEYTGTITHTSAGADTMEITLSGFGVESTGNYPGTALDFDGTDDYVNCGTGAQITGNGPRTIEAWAYAESFNEGGIFQAGATGTNLADFSLRTLTSDNQWRIQLWGSDMDVTLNNSKNSWHHYCLTYDGDTTVKLYYDGNLEATKYATLNTGSHDVWFGRWWNNYFDGKIDEVRIWNTALDSTQIRENMCRTLSGHETGLVSYWQMNDSTGNIASEVVGSNDGTLTNMDTANCWVNSTAPVPFESTADGNWSEAANWLSGQGAPSAAWSRVKINSNITLDQNIELLELKIKDGKTLTIGTENRLTVSDTLSGN